MPIFASTLIEQLKEQYNLIFSEKNKEKLQEKIKELTEKIEKIQTDITKTNLTQENTFEGWQDNFDKLKNALIELKTKQEAFSNKTSKKNIKDIVHRLEMVISELEKLFLNKTIGLSNWEEKQSDLSASLQAIEDKPSLKDKPTLNNEKTIAALKLIPLNTYTTEQGYFKEFARSINEQGNSFTKIFYLLERNEKSFFHRLDTEETWTWLGGEPLSLFVLQDNQLIEHVLDKQGQSITLPNQIWFGAILKEDLDNSSTDKHESTADNIPFTLVSCTCTPAFIIQHFHNEINEAMVDVYQKASKENQDRIYLLLTPEQQSDLKEKIALKEKEKETPNSFAENKHLFLKPDRGSASESTGEL